MEERSLRESEKRRTRVLIVDDSALMRKIITQILSQQPDMEVAGTAMDGEDALKKARLLQPDVITLDVEMPRMNGLEFLEALMPETPMRVVMLSSLTGEGAETTFACLQRGAIEFVAKPSKLSVDLKLADSGEEIVRKIRIASAARLPRIAPSKEVQKTEASAPNERREAASAILHNGDPRMVVAIAASTGGPNALQELAPMLPASLDIAYLLVQHLPVGFSRLFASRLNANCSLEVREAAEGDRPQAGTILVAKGGRHITLNGDGVIVFNDNPSLWGVCPAADVLTPSVAHYYKDRTVGVVLTGMGRDGSLGVKAIRAKGGYSIAQSEETCVVYGMPKAAVETGCVDKTLPLKAIAAEIVRLYESRNQGRASSPNAPLQRAS